MALDTEASAKAAGRWLGGTAQALSRASAAVVSAVSRVTRGARDGATARRGAADAPAVGSPKPGGRSGSGAPGGGGGRRAWLLQGSRRLLLALAPGSTARRSLREWFGRQPLTRFIAARILRRILAANLVGFGILLGGILYVSQHHAWLLQAKIDSLRVQGEIIAKAIAAEAREQNGHLVIDPEKLPELEGSRVPFRDDGFAALELSLRPERVTPILRRLIGPTNTRARIYGREGRLIVDTKALLSRGQVLRPELAEGSEKPKDFWTYFTYWIIDNSMEVYRELGTGKVTNYPVVQKALMGTATPMLLLSVKGEQMAAMAVPIQRQGAVQGVLLLSTHPGEIDKIIWDERRMIFLLAGLSLLATFVVSLLLNRTIAQPISRLSQTAEQLSRNINARQDLPRYAERRDEVGRMARAFSAMTAALFRRIENSEKFAADVAHELKNPLTAARSTAESLAYAKTPEQRDQLIRQIQNELKRLNRLITDVSNASRLDAELARKKSNPVDVTAVLSSVSEIFRDILSGRPRSIALIIDPAPYDGAYIVMGDDGRLGQVVTNLVDNALSFSPDGGTVTLRVRSVGANVEVLVEDEGPGIPEDRCAIIFDRFYTDRPATEEQRGKNSGLGLSISREIVLAHGGEIWAENRYPPGGGPKPADAPAAPTAAKAPVGRGAVKPVEPERLGARFVVRLPAAAPTGGWGGSLLGRRD